MLYLEKTILISLKNLISFITQRKNIMSQTFFLLYTNIVELIQIIICDNQENNNKKIEKSIFKIKILTNIPSKINLKI